MTEQEHTPGLSLADGWRAKAEELRTTDRTQPIDTYRAAANQLDRCADDAADYIRKVEELRQASEELAGEVEYNYDGSTASRVRAALDAFKTNDGK